jgi:hypothetical protein
MSRSHSLLPYASIGRAIWWDLECLMIGFLRVSWKRLYMTVCGKLN